MHAISRALARVYPGTVYFPLNHAEKTTSFKQRNLSIARDNGSRIIVIFVGNFCYIKRYIKEKITKREGFCKEACTCWRRRDGHAEVCTDSVKFRIRILSGRIIESDLDGDLRQNLMKHEKRPRWGLRPRLFESGYISGFWSSIMCSSSLVNIVAYSVQLLPNLFLCNDEVEMTFGTYYRNRYNLLGEYW